MLELNLQFFAKDGPGGERTEQPTSKKLTDARKEGQVAKSKEIGNALGLLVLFLILKYGMSFIGENILLVFPNVYNKIPELVKMYDGQISSQGIMQVLIHMLLSTLFILSPFLVIGFVVAFVGEVYQVKWQISAKPLKPKFSKMNPISGMKKIFSASSLMELAKSILKIGLITYVVYSELKDKYNIIYLIVDMPMWQGIALAGTLAIDLGLKCAYTYILIALIDYIYQRRKFTKDHMMSKQEIKDEYRQSEGDPQIKGKIRQKMREISRRRMMQALPQADVVITNPTHYAVAIKYDNQIADAPVVLAKGENFLAAKIKEVAKENKIQIVENKPLARMLYHNVEIGEKVPPELFQAVAEILAMVYHAQGKI